MIAQTQRIMAIPLKRFARPLLGFLSQSEMQAILDVMVNSFCVGGFLFQAISLSLRKGA
jgi:hypothetical protein